jgi:hypothetical protein
MNTSKYDSPTRKSIKREIRTPFVKKLLDMRRTQRKELEEKLSEKSGKLEKLTQVIQILIDKGQWDPDWEKLGFEKK